VPKSRGIWLVAIAAVSWGVGGFVAAVLFKSSGLGPVTVSFWRFVGGLVLLAALRPFLGGPFLGGPFLGGPWRAGFRRVLLTGAGFAVYQTAYYAAIPYAGLAVATVVTLGTGPVLIAVGSWLFLRERLGLVGALLIVLSLVGLVLLVRPSGASVSVLGVGLSLLSAAGYAAVTLLSRASRSSDDPLDAALGGFAVGAVLVLPVALSEGLLPTMGHWPETVGMLAFLAVFPTALAYVAFFTGLRGVTATTASMVALVEPVAAAALGVAILHEHLTLLAYAGGVLLLLAVATLTLFEARRAAGPGETPS
jgi:DME family drug/metabolite transporter